MSFAARFAGAAEALVGTPYRMHGRDPATGLDCVGVVTFASHRAGRRLTAPNGYALRGLDRRRLIPLASRNGLEAVTGPILRGDILAGIPGPGQLHLAVAMGAHAIVHAHAGLRRVVLQPLTDWPSAGHWRFTEHEG